MQRTVLAGFLAGVSILIAGCSGGHHASTVPTTSTDANGRQIRTLGGTTSYSIPTSSANPAGVALGPDNNIWFCEHFSTSTSSGKIGKITPSGTITEYQIPVALAPRRIDPEHPITPNAITAGPDGNMWFTDDNGAYVGSITTSGVISLYPVLGTSLPNIAGYVGITAGPDGNLWVSDQGGTATGSGFTTTENVTKVSTSGSLVGTYALSSGSLPGIIVPGPDGNLWVMERKAGGGIARVTTSGTVTEYAMSLGSSYHPYGLVNDGTYLRFTAVSSSSTTAYFGSVTTSGGVGVQTTTYGGTSGRISLAPAATHYTDWWLLDAGITDLNYFGRVQATYTLPNSNPSAGGPGATGFIYGSDGNLWYDDASHNSIVKFETI